MSYMIKVHYISISSGLTYIQRINLYIYIYTFKTIASLKILITMHDYFDYLRESWCI